MSSDEERQQCLYFVPELLRTSSSQRPKVRDLVDIQARMKRILPAFSMLKNHRGLEADSRRGSRESLYKLFDSSLLNVVNITSENTIEQPEIVFQPMSTHCYRLCIEKESRMASMQLLTMPLPRIMGQAAWIVSPPNHFGWMH